MSYFDNVTFFAYPVEQWENSYRVGVETYNVIPSRWNWNPPVFLLDRLETPFITDNMTANSSLYLIFNRLFSV